MPQAWEIELDGTRHRVELGSWGAIREEPRTFLSDGIKHSLGGGVLVRPRATTFDLGGHVGVVAMRWVKPAFKSSFTRALGGGWRNLPGILAASAVAGSGGGGGVAGSATAGSILKWVIYELTVDGESRGSWVLTSVGGSLKSAVFVAPGGPLPEPDWPDWPTPRGMEPQKPFFGGYEAPPVSHSPSRDAPPDLASVRAMRVRLEEAPKPATADVQAAQELGPEGCSAGVAAMIGAVAGLAIGTIVLAVSGQITTLDLPPEWWLSVAVFALGGGFAVMLVGSLLPWKRLEGRLSQAVVDVGFMLSALLASSASAIVGMLVLQSWVIPIAMALIAIVVVWTTVVMVVVGRERT